MAVKAAHKNEQRVLNYLARVNRPVSLDIISANIGLHRNTVWHVTRRLEQAGRIRRIDRGGRNPMAYQVVDNANV